MASNNRASERRWAVLRIVLGMLQIIGAFTLVILLFKIGPSSLTLMVGAVIVCLIVVSRLVFRGK